MIRLRLWTLSRALHIRYFLLFSTLHSAKIPLITKDCNHSLLSIPRTCRVEECMNEMHSITERDAFSYGFRLGVQLMSESFLQPIGEEENL